MAISRDTFAKIKHYAGVRLQMGVPLVDADWNESEEIAKYELQSFLKWFVGNGVPAGNDGFRIKPPADPAPTEEFVIAGGDGTPDGAGRCIVEGLDVMNESDLRYTAQQLYNTPRWGVNAALPLTKPAADRTDLVYLDVWERVVDQTEDPSLMNNAVGVPTCTRLKREWVVRVAEGRSTLPPPDPVRDRGHVFYPLALLKRAANDETIGAATTVDLRRTGLCVVSSDDVQQIVKDAFGGAYALDGDARPNLSVSLRDAINAINFGRLPATPQTVVPGITGTVGGLQLARDPVDERKLAVFWISQYRSIMYTRGNPVDGWDAPQRLTADNATERAPAVVRDGQTMWVFWESDRKDPGHQWQVYGRAYSPGAGWGAITELGNSLSSSYPSPDEAANVSALRDSGGTIWLFWVGSDGFCYYRRRAAGAWTSVSRVSAYQASGYNPYQESAPCAQEGDGGIVLVVWEARTSNDYNSHVWCRRFALSGATWNPDQYAYRVSSDTYEERAPRMVRDAKHGMLLIWRSWRQDGYASMSEYLFCRGFGSGGYSSTATVSLGKGDVVAPNAIGGDVDLLVLFRGYLNGPVYYKRYSPYTLWGPSIDVSPSPAYGSLATCDDGGGGVWVAWIVGAYQNAAVYVRKIVTLL